ncbi:Major facilitator superfamily transporter [Colletotrichum higginsianum IMI 349063]|uniref:Major facilitator superfamily transporter n=2 Tax=Colletotrichum higginsianum TaxID=80884 RepID=A0A1B7XWB1_COLHI|nr:Major facilitator superfamily transporter [Colletotrichum higginsianum IMI 349063]OBR04038.1 Major facilitator superfamily transporter [Colletotrichum higginsianum IMI 349063]TIC90270.1 Thiamine pathway transporter THI73 [Colletotrichum higginsianum]GJD03602.1 major facilitator superfamily transporter [Colletotrichum higginsianum]
MSTDDKHPKDVVSSASSDSHAPSSNNNNVDAAWKFLNTHRDAGDGTASVDIDALRRKIDWRIVPLMFLCYTMQFLDKVILNYAAVMGLSKDLKLVGNEFSNIATFLFVGLLCFEIPNIYFLQMIPAAKWLGLNVVLWGTATACGAAAHNYQTLLVSRVFLGIFEATIGPSLMLISSQWYTKSEQAPRFSFWYLGLGLGQILGGAISYGFQHIPPHAALDGWRIMFVVLGCVTVAIGVATLLFVPDTPMKATWLSDTEKVALLRHVSVNQTGIESRKFRPRQILEALMDPQMYLMTLAVVLLSVSSGVITTYSATLIRNLGYDPKRAALMNMPSGVVSIFFTLLVGYGIRRTSNRWAWIVVCIIPAIIGGALMSFLPVSNRSGCLAGIYLVNAVVAPLTVFYAWTAANFGGATKRAFAAAIVSGSFSLGNIIGPQTFQARDAPEYRPAKIAVMGTQAGCALVTLALYAYYRLENKRRGAVAQSEDAYLAPEVWQSMTDRENKSFRYTY